MYTRAAAGATFLAGFYKHPVAALPDNIDIVTGVAPVLVLLIF
jgi:hypothetical protein